MSGARAHRQGFTLLELLVAMALMTVVAACLYSSLYTGFRARRSAELSVEPAVTAANAIEVIKQDIYGALVPDGILAGSFIGDDSQDGQGSDADSVTLYTTNAHAGDEEVAGGIVMIELALIDDEDSRAYRLVRKVTTNLLSPRTLEPDEQVLCRDVRSLNLRYFDGLNWLDEWDSAGHEDSLPQAVEVDLQVRYESDDSGSQFQVRRLMQSFSLPCGVSEQQSNQ